MITLVVSGRRGPMLLSLSGCLVGSESGIKTGSPLQKGCLAVILPKAVPGNQDTAFLSNHAPIRGVLCQATPRP